MNILVVRYGTVGDSVLSSGFVREIRMAYPNAIIDILGDVVSKGVFEYCPYIDNIVEIEDKCKFFLKRYQSLFKYVKTLKKYDKIYFTRGEHLFSIAAKMAKIPERIGFTNTRSKHLTNGTVDREDIHTVDNLFNVLKADNIPVNNTSTEVWINPVSEARVKCILEKINPDNKKLIVIHASTRVREKNWLDEYWAEVLKYLDSDEDVCVVLTGSSKDVPNYNKLLRISDYKFKTEPINAAGQFSIQETMAMIKNCDLVIGLDSGIIHISSTLNIPTIVLHGCSPLIPYKPKSEKCTVVTKNYSCSPCIMNTGSKGIGCEYPTKCFKDLTPDMVIEEIKKCL